MIYYYQEAAPPSETLSYVRVLNASPYYPDIDVYSNGRPVAKGLKYKDFTEYAQAYPGIYTLQFFVAGSTDQLILEKELDLSPDVIATMAFFGDENDVDLIQIPDVRRNPSNSNKSYVRFVNLSPDSMSYDVTLDDAPTLSGLNYAETSSYVPLNAGKHSLKIHDSASNKQLLINPNVNLLPSKLYSIYVVGRADGEPSLQVLVPLEGSSYIR